MQESTSDSTGELEKFDMHRYIDLGCRMKKNKMFGGDICFLTAIVRQARINH